MPNSIIAFSPENTFKTGEKSLTFEQSTPDPTDVTKSGHFYHQAFSFIILEPIDKI